jgi:hypothetical protein
MAISLGHPRRGTRLPRRLGSGSRLSTGSASHLSRPASRTPRSIRRLLQGGLPFSLHARGNRERGMVSVALALRRGRQSGLSGPTTGPAPAFARHPALCSSDFPLPLAGQRPPGACKPCPTLVSCLASVQRTQAFVNVRLFRGRDSNPNLLIQSQLSYH